MKGHIIAGSNGLRGREPEDYYATPPEATEALLNSFNLNECQSFCEPACGEGHISKILSEHFKEAEIYSTDLIDRGFGEGGIDFLELSDSRRFDCVITNPPFRYAKEFIEKALSISNKYVIMLAKIQLLEGSGRRTLFTNNPPKYIYVFRNRVNPLRNGNPLNEKGKAWSTVICFAWFVWEKGFKGEPTIRWLETKKYRIDEQGVK